MKRIFLGLFLVSTGMAYGQDLHFSLPNASPVYYNPATIGLFKGDKLRFNTNYRRQWGSIAEPYNTIAFSADGHFFGKKERTPFWGFALGIFSDRAAAGGFSQMHFDLGASYNIWLNKFNIVSGGVLAGAGLRKFGASNMSWDNQFNGAYFDTGMESGEPITTGSAFYPDFGAGLNWRFLNREETIRLQAGAGLFHLSKPNVSMTETRDLLFRRLVLHTMAEISVSAEKNVYLVPSFYYLNHGPHYTFIFGSDVKFHFKPQSQITDRKGESSISFGLYHRTSDALLVNVRLLHAGFGLGIAYDITTSSLAPATNRKGGPEINLSFIPTMSKLATVYNQGWLL